MSTYRRVRPQDEVGEERSVNSLCSVTDAVVPMSSSPPLTGPVDLSAAGVVHHNLSAEVLADHCVERDGCERLQNGAIVARSGRYTGRTPKDKFTVREPGSEGHIWWENNNAMEAATFDRLRERFAEYAIGKELYVVDTFAGADPAERIAVRFVVERPYHALFIHQLLLRPTAEELAAFVPGWVVTDFGRMSTDPARDGVRSDATIALHPGRQEVLIAGTEYAGEMKKSIFTVMNDLLPGRGILSMHCSANVGKEGDCALFFGLSGTGKTTLSADPERELVGDDEHGWSDRGIFNIEGGCYAKGIHLSQSAEPQIFAAIREGAILENVVVHDGIPDYDDATITENTRAAYPIENIANARVPGVAGHPQTLIFLTADALGVLPPIARLTHDQVMAFFLAGYTAKVAGTEAGVTEP
ncbi:MAG: hypothetical protein C4320_09085, partial [Armatimonadota bacterium]